MAPVSTFIVQSAVAEGGDLFLEILAHLRIRYPEVYGLGLDTDQAHECRDTILGERDRFSGDSSVHSRLKLGTYAGRLANLNLSGNINPSPNLSTAYLDTPLVGPTPEPLQYIRSPGRLGQPSGYPPISTGTYIGGARIRPPPPPPPYNTHPRMNPPTGWAQPRRVLKATGPDKNSNVLVPRGNL